MASYHLPAFERPDKRFTERVKNQTIGKQLALVFILVCGVAMVIDDYSVVSPWQRRILSKLDDEKRELSKYLGDGKCEWEAPVKPVIDHTINTTTLLTSYPGSGKRLTWRLLEALTGAQTGDDWDLSEHGLETLTIKTSYPHFEGNWSWGDNMDQAIYLIRNPRWAIPSYHTMRYEIDYSTGWMESYIHRNFTYTVRPDVAEWEWWRDSGRFDREIKLWSEHIDFWLQDGFLKKDSGEPEQDEHCEFDMPDCRPKAIVQFEKLFNSSEYGPGQVDKMADVLDTNSLTVPPEGRTCVYNEVLKRKEFYNTNRDKYGPSPFEKKFTDDQLLTIVSEIEAVIERYSVSPWDDEPNAMVIVEILNEYIDDVLKEYEAQSGVIFV